MRRFLPLFAIAIVATMTYGAARMYVASGGAQTWQKKQYSEWSLKECQKILDDSPWAKSYSFEQILIQALQSNSSTSLGRENKPEMYYRVQLRSALPVRQAMVRQAQIQNHYETMTAEQKAAMDKQFQPFLTGKQFEDKIIVHVEYGSNVPDDAREMARLWQAETKDTQLNKAFLIANGARIPISGFAISQGKSEFQLVFPKAVDGHPTVTPETKSISLEFVHPAVRQTDPSTVASEDVRTPRSTNAEAKRVLVEFKIDKMMFNGQVAY